jgi:hypothetical protein
MPGATAALSEGRDGRGRTSNMRMSLDQRRRVVSFMSVRSVADSSLRRGADHWFKERRSRSVRGDGKRAALSRDLGKQYGPPLQREAASRLCQEVIVDDRQHYSHVPTRVRPPRGSYSNQRFQRDAKTGWAEGPASGRRGVLAGPFGSRQKGAATALISVVCCRVKTPWHIVRTA